MRLPATDSSRSSSCCKEANLAVNRLLGAENLSKSGSTLAAALIRGGRFHWLGGRQPHSHCCAEGR
ncbi:MAG: hypothetical protein ACLUEK_00060 [Oscillospiraceae bacterium]